MRRFHGVLFSAMLPVAAMAQDAGVQDARSVIRIEAKRGETATASAVEGWSAAFDDVVTFPLARGWTGIALGPMTAAEAEQRLATLKAEGKIPADSFVAEPGGDVALTPAEPVETTAPEIADAPEAQPDTVAIPDMDMNLNALSAPPPAAAAPDRYMRFESFQSRAEADAALEKWREDFPEAGLWQLPNGWFAIAYGPLAEDAANAWLTTFKTGELAPRDAFIATTAEMGAPVQAGSTPELGDPPAQPAPMPPMAEVQQALRWAGFYDGAIDGQDGPKTRAAITARILADRKSPDAGTAMAALLQERVDWRNRMGLTQLDDAHTGLSAIAPLDMVSFDRNERALSIYGPKEGSGAALILFSQPGGQQELIDLSGLIIALGWVPQPERDVKQGSIVLDGRNDNHISHAEGFVRDGRAEGFVLIWPASDAENQPRVAAELSDSFARKAPAANDAQPDASASASN